MALQQISSDELFTEHSVVRAIPAKVYLCGFVWILTHCIRTRYVCFISLHIVCENWMLCSLALIPRRVYDKSHRLKQRSLVGQPSLRMAVSQACPSGRIQGWYGRPSGTITLGKRCYFRVKINWINSRYKHREWQDNPWDHLIEYSRSCGKLLFPILHRVMFCYSLRASPTMFFYIRLLTV